MDLNKDSGGISQELETTAPEIGLEKPPPDIDVTFSRADQKTIDAEGRDMSGNSNNRDIPAFKVSVAKYLENPAHTKAETSLTQWILILLALYISAFLYGLDSTISADVQGTIIQKFSEPEKLAWIGVGFPLGSISIILSL
jgi:hypothetical protein